MFKKCSPPLCLSFGLPCETQKLKQWKIFLFDLKRQEKIYFCMAGEQIGFCKDQQLLPIYADTKKLNDLIQSEQGHTRTLDQNFS